MAKKKVSKKKAPTAKRGKSASARRTAQSKTKTKTKTKSKPKAKTKKKSGAAGKASSRKTVKKTVKTVVKKTTKKAGTVPAKSGSKQAPAKRAAGAAKAPSKKSTRAKTGARGVAGKTSISAAPDADGYVFINGRRVRMISAVVEPSPPTKKKRQQSRTAAEPGASTSKVKTVKTKLGKKDLGNYRNLLLIQRAELVGDLSAMEAQALRSSGGNLSHMPIHMADIGTDTYDQDFMLGLAETERRRLREIDAALQRIDDRTYGICEMTQRPIPKTRLNAKPWARYTIEAARQIEQGLGE